MIKARLQKIEKIRLASNSPYENYSNEQLNILSRELEQAVYGRMKDRNLADEFKRLFIDKPNIDDILKNRQSYSREQVFSILAEQEAWELKHAKSENDKQKIANLYSRELNVINNFIKI